MKRFPRRELRARFTFGEIDAYNGTSASTTAPGRDGISKAEPISNDVDLRQRGFGTEAEWIQRPPEDWMQIVESSLKPRLYGRR